MSLPQLIFRKFQNNIRLIREACRQLWSQVNDGITALKLFGTQQAIPPRCISYSIRHQTENTKIICSYFKFMF